MVNTWMSFEVDGKEAERVCGRGPQSSQDQGNLGYSWPSETLTCCRHQLLKKRPRLPSRSSKIVGGM